MIFCLFFQLSNQIDMLNLKVPSIITEKLFHNYIIFVTFRDQSTWFIKLSMRGGQTTHIIKHKCSIKVFYCLDITMPDL